MTLRLRSLQQRMRLAGLRACGLAGLRRAIVRSAFFRAVNIFIHARRTASSQCGTSIQRMNARISTSHPINNNKRMLRWHYDAMS
jgi:hypothetical protein